MEVADRQKERESGVIFQGLKVEKWNIIEHGRGSVTRGTYLVLW